MKILTPGHIQELKYGDYLIKKNNDGRLFVHYVDQKNKTVTFSELWVVERGNYQNPVKYCFRLITTDPISFDELANGTWLLLGFKLLNEFAIRFSQSNIGLALLLKR